ncbi:hypothetical protein EBR56_08195, partial [bacterium]|nr:hypothetical protein [bacterium]
MSDSQTPPDVFTTSERPRGSTGTIAVRDSALAPLPPSSPAHLGDDPQAGGVDFQRVWHAFRRCWLPAVALGTLLAAGAATATWVLLPRHYEAVAWLRIRDKVGMLGGGGRDRAEYEAYRKTQVALIKSPFVMTSALRRPGIADLKLVREQDEDPVGWLTRSIQVTAPMESEVVQVRLRGRTAAEVAKIVNAVTNCYVEDIVNKERAEAVARRDALEKIYNEKTAELREDRKRCDELARTLGTGNGAEVNTKKALLLDHLGTLRAQRGQAERDLTTIEAELAIIDARARGDITDRDASAELPEEIVDAALARDSQIVELQSKIAAIDEEILSQEERSARGANEPAVKRLRSQREQVKQRIDQRRDELRPQVMSQLALESPDRRFRQPRESPVVLRMRQDLLAKTIAETSQEFDKVAKEVTELGKANAEMENRRSEIEQVERVTNEIGFQLETARLDLSLPGRVTLIEEASVPEGNDRLFRTMLSLLSAGAGLVLGGGLIVMTDYVRDRLS